MTSNEAGQGRAVAKQKRGEQSPPRRLMNHRKVAELFGTSARNWRRWYETGKVPVPHQQIGTLLLYDAAVIRHRLETGQWPDGAVFKVVKAKEEDQSLPSADAIPQG